MRVVRVCVNTCVIQEKIILDFQIVILDGRRLIIFMLKTHENNNNLITKIVVQYIEWSVKC